MTLESSANGTFDIGFGAMAADAAVGLDGRRRIVE
jgi:hypothetical protein